jgi:hypothetical protein
VKLKYLSNRTEPQLLCRRKLRLNFRFPTKQLYILSFNSYYILLISLPVYRKFFFCGFPSGNVLQILYISLFFIRKWITKIKTLHYLRFVSYLRKYHFWHALCCIPWVILGSSCISQTTCDTDMYYTSMDSGWIIKIFERGHTPPPLPTPTLWFFVF